MADRWDIYGKCENKVLKLRAAATYKEVYDIDREVGCAVTVLAKEICAHNGRTKDFDEVFAGIAGEAIRLMGAEVPRYVY